MSDVEFEPFDNQELKRLGEGSDDKTNDSSRKTYKSTKNRPKIVWLIIFIGAIIVSFLAYKYYQNVVLRPKQTQAELLEIRNALHLYKENFGAYPNQLSELAKSRPLREDWLTDVWENPYRYDVDEIKQSFIVTSAGYDGKFDTDDDIQIKQ